MSFPGPDCKEALEGLIDQMNHVKGEVSAFGMSKAVISSVTSGRAANLASLLGVTSPEVLG